MNTDAPTRPFETKGTSEGTDFDAHVRALLAEDNEAAVAYARQRWISGALQRLVQERKRRGLSQREVGERLGTSQSAIARLENDDEGHISLARFVDYALAIGAMPRAIELDDCPTLREP